jgi:hypothetical protein
MLSMDDPEPTNMIRYLVYQKNGKKLDVSYGPIDPSEVPQTGDGKYIEGVGCSVVAVATTPMLPVTWHVIAKEN